MENISLEEKIDFIYKKLKRDEKERKRKLFIKYFIRITLLLIAVYMYFFWINQIITWVKNSIIETINNKKDATIEFVKDKKEKTTNFIKEKIDKLRNKNSENTQYNNYELNFMGFWDVLWNIFMWIVIFMAGVLILKFRRQIKNVTWDFVWAETRLWRWSTYFVIILIWCALLFFGVIYPFWWLDLIFDFKK